jgi:hypothetical protein
MSSQDLNRAIQLARAGDKKTARHILLKVVQEQPSNEMAWIWLADTMPDDARRIATLKQCLKLIPNSQVARKALQVLESAQKPPPTVEKPPEAAVFQPSQPSPPPVSPPPAEEPVGFESLLSLREEVFLPEEESQPPPFVQEEETEQEAVPLLRIPDGEQAGTAPFVETAAIEQLRQQAQKVPVTPASVVQQRVSPVRWGAVMGIILFAVALGVVVFTLWFSPNSPLRLSGLQPLPTELNYQPPQETPVIETQVVITS